MKLQNPGTANQPNHSFGTFRCNSKHGCLTCPHIDNERTNYTVNNKGKDRFTEHRQATNNPSYANVSAAVPTHCNLPDRSIEDMTLIPLELQPTLNTSRRKAREAYLIHRGQTPEPSGMNRRNERCLFTFLVLMLYTLIPHLYPYMSLFMLLLLVKH